MPEKKMTREEFLALFYQPRFRYIYDDEEADMPVQDRAEQGTGTLDMSWNEKGYGTFFTVNGFPPQGSATKDRIVSLNCNFADIDIEVDTQEERDRIIRDRIMGAFEKGLPMPTIVVRSKRGVHCYWMYQSPVLNPTTEQISQWSGVQHRLGNLLQGDRNARDIARLLRVPYTMHLKVPSDPFLVYVQDYCPQNIYELSVLHTTLPQSGPDDIEVKTSAMDLLLKGVPVGKGLRHGALAQIAGLLLRGANTAEQVAIARQNLYDWDEKIVRSTEAPESRRREIDSIFEGILKRETEKISPAQGGEKIELMRWGPINAIAFPPDRWRVPDLIPKAGAVILAAISGEGKTWVGLELARCISSGEPVFGSERFIPQKCRVLYIDDENGKWELQRRGRLMKLVDSENLLFYPADILNLNDEGWATQLKETIEKEKIEVVIVDTFRAVAGGIAEEKAELIRMFFNRYKGLKERSVCIIWLDHFRKPERLDGKTPKKEHLFGSQDKAGSVEILLLMKKENDEITLYQAKNRMGREQKPFVVKMTETFGDDGEPKIAFEYVGVLQEDDVKKDIAKEYILTLLKEGAKTTSEVKRVLRDAKDIQERNVRDALKELREGKKIGRHKRGREDEYFLIENADAEFDEFVQDLKSQ